MPYYRSYPWRRRRYRWPRRWRARRFIRRRYHRRYRVRRYSRKRKLSKLTLKEWQPEKINKTTVKGLYPLFLCTKDRISNNAIQYLDSIAPPHFPGGGGFSIIQFTLQGLYEEFIKAKNWWTKTNCFLPLIRYNGCSIKFYKTEYFDYNVLIHRCYPLKATDELYMSTQPGIMGLTKRCIHIPCKHNSKDRKIYKKVWVKPPTQMQTGWHFQKDIANFPLLIITSCATSYDRYFTSSNSQSTTIGFTSLNTKIFQFHDWQDPPTTGYRPNRDMYFWGTENGMQDPMQEPLENLIYLGGTGKIQKGTPIKNRTSHSYESTPGLWGNIFHPDYTTGTSALFTTNKPVHDVVQKAATNSVTVGSSGIMTAFKQPILINCRYNPFNDKSKNNKIYLVSNHSDHTEWQPPPDKPGVLRENLPLWLETWGYLDWMRKAQIVSQPDINYICVIQSDFISSTPKLSAYVPIDENFFHEPPSSPYQDTLNASDTLHFYPKVTFQIQSINNIASTGPGTIKLQTNQACEAKFEYKFKFKVGGCPAPMEKLCDPSNQEKYPIPNFKQQSTSLQSPGTAIQTYIYNFDERRGLLTEKAAKRIKKDYETEKFASQIAGTAMDLPAPYQGPPETDTSSSEEEEETTFKLLRLRHRQHQLRKRILHLISQNTE